MNETRCAAKRIVLGAAAVLVYAVCATQVAAASTPTAIVEDISPKVVGIDFMDYLEAGRVIRLLPGDAVTVSYLRSCVRERVVGAEFEIGEDESRVSGGSVERSRVSCDAGRIASASPQDATLTELAHRGMGQAIGGIKVLPKPQLVLYGAAPVISVEGGGEVEISRVSGTQEDFHFTAPDTHGHTFVDLAKLGKSLTPGALYVATAGGKQVLFRVHRDAQPGETPLLGRLIIFTLGK